METFSFKSENSIEQLYQRSGVALVQWLIGVLASKIVSEEIVSEMGSASM